MFSPLITGSLTVAAIRAARRAGGGEPLLILTYHRVLVEADPLLPSEPDIGLFREQMSYLARYCQVLPLPEAVARLQAGTLPRRAVCVSFDDGYANNAHVALPVLEELGLKATFFVATGYLDGGCMWNDAVIETLRRFTGSELDLRAVGLGRYELPDIGARRAAINQLLNQLKYRPLDERTKVAAAIAGYAEVILPADLMMSSTDVRLLYEKGMDVGGHTVNHPILARIADDVAWREIVDGRDALTRITGAVPRTFAYPNGGQGTILARPHGDGPRSGLRLRGDDRLGVRCCRDKFRAATEGDALESFPAAAYGKSDVNLSGK